VILPSATIELHSSIQILVPSASVINIVALFR
jgi:hypothetical protein